MPSIEVYGVKAHYTKIGTAGPLGLMVHAATNHGAQWDLVRAAMGPDYRYLLPDLFNSGGTAPWPQKRLRRDLNFDDEADIVLSMLMAIDEPVHLVGHSYGGAVALRAAIRSTANPDGGPVRSLCLIEPGGCPLLAEAERFRDYEEYVGVMREFLRAVDAGEPVSAWRDFLNYYRGHRDAWDSLDKSVQDRIVAKTETQRQVYAAQMSNPTTLAELRNLKMETLVITGGQTTAPERAVCEVLVQYLPHARLHIIPNAGHPMPASHPKAVAAALSRHIDDSELFRP